MPTEAQKGYDLGNETAFPRAPGNETYGMTKREYFAGLAMQGMLAGKINVGHPGTLSQFAVEHADSLLIELSKQP